MVSWSFIRSLISSGCDGNENDACCSFPTFWFDEAELPIAASQSVVSDTPPERLGCYYRSVAESSIPTHDPLVAAATAAVAVPGSSRPRCGGLVVVSSGARIVVVLRRLVAGKSSHKNKPWYGASSSSVHSSSTSGSIVWWEFAHDHRRSCRLLAGAQRRGRRRPLTAFHQNASARTHRFRPS